VIVRAPKGPPPAGRVCASVINWLIGVSLRNRFLVVAAFALLAGWGYWALCTTPIDAIPDLSDNQVIVRKEIVSGRARAVFQVLRSSSDAQTGGSVTDSQCFSIDLTFGCEPRQIPTLAGKRRHVHGRHRRYVRIARKLRDDLVEESCMPIACCTSFKFSWLVTRQGQRHAAQRPSTKLEGTGH
jgi:hypothetical protein